MLEHGKPLRIARAAPSGSKPPGSIPNFSWDLAVHGDWAAVGAFDGPSGEARAPGAVYLFQQQGTRWTFQQKLTQKKWGSSTSNNAHFGSDAQLDGRWLAVNAVKEDRSATATVTGAVYLYRRNGGTWEEHVRLAPADLTQGDHFGRGLSISGNLLAVSAAQRNETNPEASSDGAVYVFRREGSGATAVWQRETKLFGRTAGLENTFGDDFGEILALDGNYLAVSASSTGDFEGAVYVFERQGLGQWEQVARLRARKEGYVHKHFGSSVALSGDCLTAGSTYEDGGRGAAYVFCREASGAWTLSQRLVAGRRQGSSLFGEDVALDGDVVLVGAPGEDREDGAAYLFERTPQGWVPFGQ